MKKFLAEVKSRVVGPRPGPATQQQQQHDVATNTAARRGRGGEGVSPPEYADTNVKFVPKINRELKSG